MSSMPSNSGPGRSGAWVGIGLSLVTVVLVALAFPPFGLWPLVLIAFVPMVVAQHCFLPRRGSAIALGVGLGGWYAYRFSPALLNANVSRVVQAWAIFAALFITAIAWRSRAFQERTRYRWFVVSAPVAWVALDFLRASGPEVLGGTFGYPGYALYGQPWLLQPISVFGMNGLELLILMINWALAGLTIAMLDRRWNRDSPLSLRRAAWGSAGVALLAVGWTLASAGMMGHGNREVRVAAIQTGVTRGGAHWQERYARDLVQTRKAAAMGARLVVWNEEGLRINPTKKLGELRALVAETGVYLAVGYGFTDARGLRHNEVLLMAPDGHVLGVYGKDHPGTYAGDFSDTRGTYPVFNTTLGPIATIICYDLDFTDTARKMADRGARLVAVPSADVPAIADTHFTHLVFRAIENRVSMVKADNEFDSAIIDPWGRILKRAVSPEGGLQATLVADIPLGSANTPWVHLGDWVGWASVAGTLAFFALSLRRRRPDAED